MVELITALENMVSAVENLETDAEVITTTVAPIEDKESQTKKDDSDESTERSDSDEDDVDDGLETDSDEVSIDIPILYQIMKFPLPINFLLKDEDDDSDEAFEDDYFILPDPTDLLPIDPLIHMLIGGYGPRGPIPEIGIMRPTYFNILFTFLEIF